MVWSGLYGKNGFFWFSVVGFPFSPVLPFAGSQESNSLGHAVARVKDPTTRILPRKARIAVVVCSEDFERAQGGSQAYLHKEV